MVFAFALVKFENLRLYLEQQQLEIQIHFNQNIMTLQERKKELIRKIESMSDEQIKALYKTVSELLEKENQDKNYIENSEFEELLKQDLEQYKEVWKELA